MPKSSDKDDYECPVFSSSPSKCDQDALEVMGKFKDFYEEKLKEIDRQGGGDCLEMKLKVQRRWIDDLTEQTQMMGKIVKELEEEATNRVRMLEKKLHQTSKSAYEKVFYLENDMKNLIEFIRRVRDDKKWSIEGLQFYDVTHSDLFGKGTSCDCEENKDVNLIPISNGHSKEPPPDGETETQNIEYNQTYDQLAESLKRKTEEYENLRQSMLDMRSALTEEVACKHDMISALKKDIQQLEERCVQSDKQTAFKDDIIKELRKEIKQLKQAISQFTSTKSKCEKTSINTVKHCRHIESPRISTVIFINESQKHSEIQISKNTVKTELSKSEIDLLKASCLREIPVKEKSKFTVTSFNKVEKVGNQG